MSHIFSELSNYGLNEIIDVEVFESEKSKKVVTKKNVDEINPAELLYDRTITCPVCNSRIHTRSLKSGKVKFERTELDLRPIYNGFEPSLYDVIACGLCGYASLNKTFKKITPKQVEMVKDKISCRYRGANYPDIYTYEIAIVRYKLALLNSTVINAKNSEKAYLCLKIAWLYRGWAEQLLEQKKHSKHIEICKNAELEFIKKAYEGFKNAYENERFPAMGFDEITMAYLIGELARRLGKYDLSLKYIAVVFSQKNINVRLKDKAREVKQLIREKQKDIKNKEEEIHKKVSN
jgi:uncharacterized protein (DUF2225 family)